MMGWGAGVHFGHQPLHIYMTILLRRNVSFVLVIFDQLYILTAYVLSLRMCTCIYHTMCVCGLIGIIYTYKVCLMLPLHVIDLLDWLPQFCHM